VKPALDNTVKVTEVRSVCPNRRDVVTDQSNCLVELCLPTAKDNNVSAFGNKTAGDRQADAAASAADDGCLSRESGHWSLPVCV
jgi:hypothetical protein